MFLEVTDSGVLSKRWVRTCARGRCSRNHFIAALLQADPQAFFLTDHYRNYPMVLVRLDKVRSDALAGLIERAWRMRAGKTLLARFDAAQSAPRRTRRLGTSAKPLSGN